jgi:hypothetical protein
VRGTVWDSKIIEWQTRCWCSHVEFVSADYQNTFGAQLKGGVKWRSVADRCYRDVKRWEIWTYDSTALQEDLFNGYMAATLGDKYDWKEILSFGLGERDWHDSDRAICSTWAMAGLIHAGIVQLPEKLPVTRIDPRDVYMIFTVLIGVEQAAATVPISTAVHTRLLPRLAPAAAYYGDPREQSV